MKFSTLTSTAALTLAIPTVLGDFSMYASSVGGNGISGNSMGWQVYSKTSGPIGCNDALGWVWRKSNDVSGGKYGVRCKGSKDACTRATSGEGIKELELNARRTSKDENPHFSKAPFRSNLERSIHVSIFKSQDLTITLAAYYANRGGAIVDLKDNKIGTCTVAPDQYFYCGINAGQAQGARKLDCISSLTEKDFKQPS